MKILLFGKTGQLGWELQRALCPLGALVAPSRADADLENLASVREAIRNVRPDVIVNAAAYTAVDKAETEVDRAGRINCEAVDVMAAEAARLRAWLVHYSTDYVFAGTQTRPYREDDPVGPASVYGRTKLAGEEALRAVHERHFIFRTSWVFAARGENFAKTILRLAREREELAIVADQHGAPTSAELIADVTALALHTAINHARGETLAGTYHLVPAGETTWYDYARYVVAQALEHGAELRVRPERIRPIPTERSPLPAPRPKSSRLDTSKLQAAFNIRPPDWRGAVARLVAELS